MYQIDIAPDFMGAFQLNSVKDCPEYVEWLEHGLWIIEIWAQSQPFSLPAVYPQVSYCFLPEFMRIIVITHKVYVY